MYGPDGSPNGVVIVRASRSTSSSMSYRPLPPMMPILGVLVMISAAWALGLPALLQLHEDAVRARRMNECHESAFSARSRPLVDQADATRLELVQRTGDVVDPQSNVVKTWPSLLDVL